MEWWETGKTGACCVDLVEDFSIFHSARIGWRKSRAEKDGIRVAECEEPGLWKISLITSKYEGTIGPMTKPDHYLGDSQVHFEICQSNQLNVMKCDEL